MTSITRTPLSETNLLVGDETIVSIGEYKVLQGVGVLKALGLGSCIGVCIYDAVARVAGLSHVFLPCSKDHSNSNVGKFADTALVLLVHELVSTGAHRERLEAKIAGGANLLDELGDSFLDIGRQNLLAVEQVLAELQIPIRFRDTGGKKGRSLKIDVATCEVYLSVVGEGEKKV